MTINYIVNGFDKDFYNFDAVVVPVVEDNFKGEQHICAFREDFLRDFKDDFNEIIQDLRTDVFRTDRTTTVKSEKTGIYYIFIMVHSLDDIPENISRRKKPKICDNENYIYCCTKLTEYINNIDFKNMLIHPMFNKADFNHNTDSDFLAKSLECSVDKFSRKNIYILVEDSRIIDRRLGGALYRLKNGRITMEECKRIYREIQAETANSYTSRLIRIAEEQTKFKEKTIIQQFWEEVRDISGFFDDCINNYSGTYAKLAENAGIDGSTLSKIRSHTYDSKKRTVVISLAIALDLTADDREKFIKSAGFNYPSTEHDYFIEQQLKKKRYNRVVDFNNDVMDEYPKFTIGTKSLK